MASNVDVIDPKDGKRVPLAQRFKKFETKKRKARVVAFGFLFDFKENASNSFVQPIEETITEDWFQAAAKDREVDLFLVIGHIPAHSDEFSTIYKSIRDKQWDVPIMFFGGHRHIRDYAIYDAKAHALASGRYFETVGFQSISGLSTTGKEKDQAHVSVSPSFARRYIDNNLNSYHHHTGLNADTFPTEHGQNVSTMIASARQTLGLDHQLGCAPEDLWMTRAEYPSKESLYSWLESEVVPRKVVDPDRSSSPRIIIVNTGAMRFDVFKGPVTRDTMWIISPFANGFRYIKDVPYATADRVRTVLNDGPDLLRDIDPSLGDDSLAPPEQHRWTQARSGGLQQILLPHGAQSILRKEPDLTPGYTTKDDAGEDGDDTLHSPITHYKVPNCFETRVKTTTSQLGTTEDDPKPVEKVDLIFIAFIQPWVLASLKFLGGEYEEKDTLEYLPGRNFTGLITEWVEEEWKGKC